MRTRHQQFTHRPFRIPRSAFRIGFTLIELLVVITIILALLAIILPSMGRSIGYAETAKCQSNMRQIMYGCIAYASDHFRDLPQPNWLSVEDGGAGDWTGAGWLYKWPNRSLPEHVEQGVVWQYVNTFDVYHCPSHAKPWGDGGRTTEALTSYNMNGSVCDYGGRRDKMHKLGDFRGGDILFWEQDENSNAWNDGSNSPPERITPRHSKAGQIGAGNVAMQDGTVDWISLDEYNTEALPAHPAVRTRLWNVPFTDRGW